MLGNNAVFIRQRFCFFIVLIVQKVKKVQTNDKSRNTYIASGVASIEISRVSNLTADVVGTRLKDAL